MRVLCWLAQTINDEGECRLEIDQLPLGICSLEFKYLDLLPKEGHSGLTVVEQCQGREGRQGPLTRIQLLPPNSSQFKQN